MALGSVLEARKLQRVFIVTDPVIDRLFPMQSVRDQLHGFEVSVFARMAVEGPEQPIQEAVHEARAFAPDVILGLGGGSNMDAAKMVSVCMAHGGQPADYAGDCVVPGPVVPLACLPTTAGTGSEVSPAAVFTEAKRGIKVSCLSPYVRPQIAIVDPAFTDECPKKLTAESGIDALTHAIEAYLAVEHDEFASRPPAGSSVYQGRNPFADAMAEECIHRVGLWLRDAVHQPSFTTARDEMALAATFGGLAFSNAGVSLVHAMEYPLGAAVHASHGCGNGLLLPYVMRFQSSAVPERMSDIAELLGCDAIRGVEELKTQIGIPARLRDIGVTEAMLPGFAETAFAIKRLLRTSPRMPTLNDILQIYREAW